MKTKNKTNINCVPGERYAMYEFIINTEPNDSTPAEIVENLKFIFNQK